MLRQNLHMHTRALVKHSREDVRFRESKDAMELYHKKYPVSNSGMRELL